MKERGILFSTQMVIALLNGSKTMTRRTVKFPSYVFDYNCKPDMNEGQKVLVCNLKNDVGIHDIKCPYGEVGDILWVREEHKIWSETTFGNETWRCEYKDGFTVAKFPVNLSPNTLRNLRRRKTLGKWQRARFLPKDFARIYLEITDIKVERLLDITEEDAVAEGLREYDTYSYIPGEAVMQPERTVSATEQFKKLWQSIYGKESWQANPWLWCISFKRKEI